MNFIASLKQFFIYSLLLVVAVLSLLLAPVSAIASVNSFTVEYSNINVIAQADIEEEIAALRKEKYQIGKDTNLTLEDKKAKLSEINAKINRLDKIADLRKEKYQIGKDTNLTLEDKKAKLSEINAKINQLLKEKSQAA